jgi:hypothetical protein
MVVIILAESWLNESCQASCGSLLFNYVRSFLLSSVQKYRTECHYQYVCGNIGHAIDRRKEFDGTESFTAVRVQSYVLGTNRSNQDSWTVQQQEKRMTRARHNSKTILMCALARIKGA